MILELIAAVTPDSASAKEIFDGAKSVTFTAVPPEVPWLSALGSIATVIVAALSVVASLVNKRKIEEVHILVNSQFSDYKQRVAELLALEKALSKEQGKLEAVKDKQCE